MTSTSSGPSIRARRLEQEWRLLQEFAGANAGLLEVLGRRTAFPTEEFEVRLHLSPAITDPNRPDLGVLTVHDIRLSFPRFFPTMPIEAYLKQPVFHPNVDPANGFVCLWTRNSLRDHVMEAIRRLQQVIGWKLVNREADHVMQPAALAWLNEQAPERQPLAFTPLRELERFRLEKEQVCSRRSFRRRLAPV
jgi:hypothetical protein